MSGAPCSPTHASSPPLSTASPSTPTSSKPTPSPTAYAPARPPLDANKPAERVGPKSVPIAGARSLDETHVVLHREPIARSDLKADPRFARSRIMTQPFSCNPFKVTDEEWEAIADRLPGAPAITARSVANVWLEIQHRARAWMSARTPVYTARIHSGSQRQKHHYRCHRIANRPPLGRRALRAAHAGNPQDDRAAVDGAAARWPHSRCSHRHRKGYTASSPLSPSTLSPVEGRPSIPRRGQRTNHWLYSDLGVAKVVALGHPAQGHTDG